MDCIFDADLTSQEQRLVSGDATTCEARPRSLASLWSSVVVIRELVSYMDARQHEVWPYLEATYGSDAAGRWLCRSQIFDMACQELFGIQGGDTWGVSYYLLKRPHPWHRPP